MLAINTVLLLGEVIEGPAFTSTQNGRDFASFRLRVTEEMSGKVYYNVFEVKVFGTTVHTIENMQPGDLCSVTGRLQQNNAVDSNGVVHKEYVVIGSKVTWEVIQDAPEPQVKNGNK